MTDFRELYQELIIDHGRHPRNFKSMLNASVQKEGFNPLCGDHLNLFLKIENNQVMDISFEGGGCAISMASASLMTEILKGKNFSDAKKIFNAFHRLMINADESEINLLGKLVALKGVADYPSRVKCATLAWHTLMAGIENQQSEICVTTE